MERELIATGIGGQGVQLAAQIVARAAVHDGLEVQMFGSYGGMMRGGNTDAALVLAQGPVMAPPVIAHGWLGMAMHHAYLPGLVEKLRPDSVLFVNTSVVEGDTGFTGRTVEVPATDIAVDAASLDVRLHRDARCHRRLHRAAHPQPPSKRPSTSPSRRTANSTGTSTRPLWPPGSRPPPPSTTCPRRGRPAP